MSPLSDALQNPSAALSDLYEKNKTQGIDTFPATVTSHFSSIFNSQNDFQRIPVLDLNHPPESFAEISLVVFHAMVQDTSLSPELYLAVRNNDQCGGWGSSLSDEHATQDEDVQYENLRECTTFWAVSIPGLSPWCYVETQSSPSLQHLASQGHKFPVPGAPHIGVQLKIYDENLAKHIRTVDLVSFVGILTSEPLHASIDLPSPTHVPTLHTLFSVPITRTILPRSFPEPSLSFIHDLRKELIQWIADEGLGGDLLAAESVFLFTLSRVRSRHPPILPLSLTLSAFPAPPDSLKTTPALYHVLAEIFPLVTVLPLTLETLNNGAFCPESKDDQDLHSGWLQQPKGSILIITEGSITEGGIFNKGVMNLRTTQEMMKEQKLDYVFPFSNFQFETDVNFLITTEGRRSTFFKTDSTIPLRSTTSPESLYKPAADISRPSPQTLLKFRQLVGGSMIGNVTVGETVGKHVEDDFVRERSAQESQGATETKSTFTPDDLIQRMHVARLTAISLHQPEVTVTDWEAAKELERQVKVRA